MRPRVLIIADLKFHAGHPRAKPSSTRSILTEASLAEPKHPARRRKAGLAVTYRRDHAAAVGLLELLGRRALAIVEAKAPGVALAAVERALMNGEIRFDARSRERARALLPTLSKAARVQDWARFPGSPGRLPFLAASRSFLRGKENEFVVVGLGTWAGKRSVVREVFVREGSKGSAGLPASVQSEIGGHLEEGERAEVLHVHNHPAGLHRDIKNMLVGNAPVPSTDDRDVLAAHLEAALKANTKGGNRRALFYLVENGLVHEYELPPWNALRPIVTEVLKALGWVR